MFGVEGPSVPQVPALTAPTQSRLEEPVGRLQSFQVALEHEADYPTETIDDLMQEADVGESEAAAMFEEVTGKPLRPG